jgi:hypothetical protein
MFRKIALVAVAALFCGPALAREGRVDYGRNESRSAPQGKRHRSGAWIGDNHRRGGAPHGGQWHPGHGHFSPRGQGGHHWGW